MSFLTDRHQATKLGFHLSSKLPINRSIIQGCGIGPTFFIMFAYDLRPLDILNFLIKYADDATLLSPQNSKTSVELEMAHISMNSTNETLLFDRFLIMYDVICVFSLVLSAFLYFVVHMCECHMY